MNVGDNLEILVIDLEHLKSQFRLANEQFQMTGVIIQTNNVLLLCFYIFAFQWHEIHPSQFTLFHFELTFKVKWVIKLQ